jgi:NADPH-dependent 7-cyano-7-deazaguanine reductase QueF
MSPVKTVSAPAAVNMSITAPAQHLCPFVNEVDAGTVTISWETAGATFELHSLRAYIESFTEAEISHEELTDTIRNVLSEAPGITSFAVQSSWTTAGMEVTCSSSPTPAGQP